MSKAALSPTHKSEERTTLSKRASTHSLHHKGMYMTPTEHSANTTGTTTLRWMRVLLTCLLGSMCFVFACGDQTPTKQPTKIILTPFPYSGFGSSTDSLLVVVSVEGSFVGERCLFVEIQHAPSNAMEAKRFKGEEILTTQSIFIINQMNACQQKNISCVPGLITKKKREFVVQVDRYGRQGGLFTATLFQNNCERQSDVVTRNTLPIGDIVPFEPEPSSESTTEQPVESTGEQSVEPGTEAGTETLQEPNNEIVTDTEPSAETTSENVADAGTND
ncbi:MAG TPA: hypothetical protein DCE42_18675 [Myxococcales bacterium]|nr:hypothetical protein [Deltaproteobacteria bacterium]MBU51380.1 hypothetical protein [Deltaproteobacteria bacterium]HAA56798.1 hypothetical protein [Myxococcales bacterium]